MSIYGGGEGDTCSVVPLRKSYPQLLDPAGTQKSTLSSSHHLKTGADIRRMPSSGMLRRVALVRTDVLEELSASIIRLTRIGELGTLAVTSNRRTLRINTT
jgi:hypothetical protein